MSLFKITIFSSFPNEKLKCLKLGKIDEGFRHYSTSFQINVSQAASLTCNLLEYVRWMATFQLVNGHSNFLLWKPINSVHFIYKKEIYIECDNQNFQIV